MVRPLTATLVRSESGAVLVEYAVVMSLLSVLLGGLWAIETATTNGYVYVTTELQYYAQRNGS